MDRTNDRSPDPGAFDLDALSIISASLAAGATELSEKLNKVEAILAELPGKIETLSLADGTMGVSFRRVGGQWSLCLGGRPQSDLSIKDKAVVAGHLPQLIRQLFQEIAERRDEVAVALLALNEAEALLRSSASNTVSARSAPNTPTTGRKVLRIRADDTERKAGKVLRIRPDKTEREEK